MADTAEIIAIMRHAAQRLEEEDARGSRSTDVAMTYAAVVLRMVAAVMDETPTPEVPGA
jgi:hypothetical protein